MIMIIENEQTALQKDINKWKQFVEGEVIVKHGFVNKRKGLFARKRMLLLTTGPRLIYIDPVQMVKKGEIPMSRDLRSEPRNFKIFFVHTVSKVCAFSCGLNSIAKKMYATAMVIKFFEPFSHLFHLKFQTAEPNILFGRS